VNLAKSRSDAKGPRAISGIVVSVLLFAFCACNSKSLTEQLLDETQSPFGDVGKVKDLVAKGADVNGIDERGWNPLFGASWMGRPEIVKALLDAGADIKHLDKYNYTALMEAVQGALLWTRNGKPMFDKQDYENTVKLLIASGVNVNDTNHLGSTALQMAVEKSLGGQPTDPSIVASLVRILLEGGADPDKGKSNLIIAAAMNGQTDAVRALTQNHKERIDRRNIDGDTALMLAIRYEHFETARVLADMGADINAQNEKGQTALIIAAEKNDVRPVESILELKADVNKKDGEGKTALHHAVVKGHQEVIKSLLARGADPNLADNNGMTPLKTATWANRTDVADLLKTHGAK